MRKRSVFVLAAVIAIDLLVGVVAAQTTGGGYLGGGDIGGWVHTTGGGAAGGTGGTGGGGSSGGGGSGGGGPAPTCTGDAGPAMDFSGSNPDSQLVSGLITYEKITGSGVAAGLDSGSGGRTVINAKPSPDAQGDWYVRWCGSAPRGFGGYLWVPQGSTPQAVGNPPAPPTQAEVQDRTPLPRPTFGVSPIGTGLTGMETWLWDANGSGGRSVTSSIRGYTVTSTAYPTHWEWTMASPDQVGRFNPNPVLGADRPGSPDDPAARYVYESTGGYTLTLTVTWTGSYTYSGNGSAPQTQPLGTAEQSSSRDYRVVEVRSVLAGSPAG